MKRLLTILLSFLSILLGYAGEWTKVDCRFDSLTELCEATVNWLGPVPEFHCWIRQMDSIAVARHDKVMKWRALYWGATFYARYPSPRKALYRIDRAMEMVDSVRYPYDWQRMKTLRWSIAEKGDMTVVYNLACRDLDYYTSIGDKLMMARMNVNVARAYDTFGMWDKAIKHNEEGARLYREIGYGGAADKGRALVMTQYARMGDTISARRIYRELLASVKQMEDTAAMISFYNNGFSDNLDPTAIYEAYRLAMEFGDRKYKAICAINLGAGLLARGRAEEALGYISPYVGQDYSGFFEGYEIVLNGLGLMSTAYEATGRIDSAYFYAKQFYSLRDSLDRLNNNANFKARYEKLAVEREAERLEREQSRHRNRLVITILVFSLLLAGALGVAWYMHTRRRLREAENLMLKSTIETSDRELTTSTLLLMDKRRMIDDLTRRIEEHGRDGHIDSSTSRELRNFIRVNQGSEEGLMKFHEYFNRVHPHFLDNLKRDFPELTKGEVRLCAYIRIGLDNKQIAHVLAVQPEAVRQARYRMRKKMGLRRSDSLEDFLASRSNPAN